MVDATAPGTYTVTWTATDASGNSTSVSRTVEAVDTTAPVITLNGEDPLVLECVVDSYVNPGATVTDACDPEPSLVTSGAVDALTVGTYTVTYTASDASGNTAIATRTVQVVDTIPPQITWITPPQTVECSNPEGEEFTVSVTAEDLCDPTLEYQWFDELGSLPGNDTSILVTFGLGNHEVRVVVKDDSGNTTEGIVSIVVEDNAPPEI